MKIRFTEIALLNLEEIGVYLEQRWSTSSRSKFSKAIEEAKATILKTPEAFPVSHKFNGVRKYLVKRKTVLFYRIEKNEIVIVQAFDARVNYEDKQKWKQ